MNATEMNEKFNELFQAIQRQVPYNTTNRDSAMCGKYSMYIGALEELIKTYVPKNKQAQLLRDLEITITKF